MGKLNSREVANMINAALRYRTWACSHRGALWTWVPLLGIALLLVGCGETQSKAADEQSATTVEKTVPPKAADATTLKPLEEEKEIPKSLEQEKRIAAAREREAQDEDAGCGKDTTAFPPPELDKNQPGTPRYVVAKKQVEAEPVWSGKQLTFKFTVGNQGTGDLAVKLRGG
jgi:hypothetical protein